jgi:SAM-dependent methyltransferase
MRESYDQVPYPNLPHRHTRPEWLELVARLFGVAAPPAATARVLEIGCAVGGNLLPLAQAFPQARFVGIDISPNQIERARAVAAAAGLENVDLRALDLVEIGNDFGEFDYIIAHGVYSWVPDAVKKRLLDVCGERLAPTGVALVSHNVKPGWLPRSAARAMMLYHTEGVERPTDRIAQARMLLAFLLSGARAHDRLYKAQLAATIEETAGMPDELLFHDHLAEVNDACYFHELVAELPARGLQFLADADLPSMFPNGFGPDVIRLLERLGSDIVRREQYLDFLKNRPFRTTLLVRSGVEVRRRLAGQQVLDLRLASKAEHDAGANLDDDEPVGFRITNASVTVAAPITKRALATLRAGWPRSFLFAELGASSADEANALARDVLQLVACGLIEVSLGADLFALPPPPEPRATPLARAQAASGERVTNLRHEAVELDDDERRLLAELDGRARAADAVLERLARNALVCAPTLG